MVAGDKFLVYAPARVGDFTHWGFLGDIYGPNEEGTYNAQAPRMQQYGPVGNGRLAMSATTVGVSGTNNGAYWLTATGSNWEDLQKVYLWFPERATPPKRTGSGTPLAAGYYWVTRQPGNAGRVRLHDTLESATESVGVSTASSSCIKYDGTAPAGEVLFEYADGINFATNLNYTNGGASTSLSFGLAAQVPDGENAVMTFLSDYDNASYSYPITQVYLNGTLVTTIEHTDMIKGVLPAISDESTSAAWVFMGDFVPHVPFHGRIYAWVLGGSTGTISSSDIEDLHTYYQTKYSIT